MKKITILCVGKIKEKYFTDAIAEYKKRLTRYADFNIVELPDGGDRPNAKQKESELLLEKMKGYNMLLDLKGKPISSEELSTTLSKAFTDGKTQVNLIIGGSHGVENTVLQKADMVINFGKITFPHQLMRVVLSEQIYRAMCIENNTPYHK